METFIINVVGGPGVGKSLIAALIFAQLKLNGQNVEYIPEYAKKLVWLREFDTLNNQHYVSSRQFKLMKSMVGNVKFIVTDGSLLHGLYYNRYNLSNTSDKQITESKIIEYYNTFNNINIYLLRGDYKYEQAGRIQSEFEAREVDTILLDILKSYKIPCIMYKSDPDNINDITNKILSTSEAAISTNNTDTFK